MATREGVMTVTRIVTLSGGGVRGILQARYLQKLEETLTDSVRRSVDLLAGTSTGSITAGLLAAGLDAAHVYDLFIGLAREVFQPRTFAVLRGGGRYDPDRLFSKLQGAVGNIQLGQLSIPVVITASVVDTHAAKTFSSITDPEVTLTDAIMASCAAPTYFPPRRIVGDNRGFYDGGLWANDPLDVAIAWCARHTRSDLSRISVLSLGTGRMSRGSSIADLERMPTLSVRTVKNIWEMTTSLQASASGMLAGLRLPEGAVVRVDPELPRWVALDDAESAISLLPGVADHTFEVTREQAVQALATRRDAHDSAPSVQFFTQEAHPAEYSIERLLERATAFHFLARSGVTLFSAYEKQLGDAVRRGCELRFLATDPEAAGFDAHDDIPMNRVNLEKTASHLVRLARINPAKVHARLIPYPPTAGIIYVQQSDGQELLIIQLYFAAGRVGRDRPLFFLHPGSALYGAYEMELNQLWETGSPWGLIYGKDS